MCEPVTAALMIGSTLLGAYGQIQAGKQEEAWANYQAKQAEADAAAERGAGMVEAERIRKLGRRQIAEATAQYAGSGIDVGEGTPLVINRQIEADAESDAYLAIVGAQDRARRGEAEAQGLRIGGRQARAAANVSAATTLLSGGYTVAKGWKTKKPGGG